MIRTTDPCAGINKNIEQNNVTFSAHRSAVTKAKRRQPSARICLF